MRRASTLAVFLLAAAGGLTLADAAAAQSSPPAGETRGMRYLSWPGRPAPMTSAADPAVQPAPARASLRRPNPVIPHGGFASSEAAAPNRLTPAPGPVRRTLTPANAWLRPAAAPEPPPPAAPAIDMPPPAPAPTPQPRPAPDYLPDQGGRSQPAPVEAVYPAAVERNEGRSADPAFDPMAPRRDAPIFRMERAAPPQPQPQPAPAPAESESAPPAEAPPQPRPVAEVANSGERPPEQGARYYSVHRQNGREPDALVIPESTYVDALVVSMTESPATQDLAEPAQGPTLIRDRNGNMRAPAASDGDHQ